MKNILRLSLSFCLLSLLSCKKDTPLSPEIPAHIKAGNEDNMVYTEYGQPIALIYTSHDSTVYSKFGNDSIDVDLDGVYDFILNSKSPYQMEYNVPQSFYYSLQPVSNIELAYTEEILVTKYGNFKDYWVNGYNHNDHISKEDQVWRNTTTYFWEFNPMLPSASKGPWFDGSHGTRYVGIRKKVNHQYKYGWVKINHVSRDEIYFVGYALEN